MTRAKWDQVGEKEFEVGVDHGMLYLPNLQGQYDQGEPWNGLVSINETPSGAEANKQYADNTVYANIKSAEEFGGTIEAFMYPDSFAECNGEKEIFPGVTVGQQSRRSFGLSYRTLKGNDTLGTDFGYKIHLVYGADAAPSEKTFETINDSPEAGTMSWELTTVPVEVPGLKPTATLTFDSTKVDGAKLAELENILYGTESEDPRLPLPAEVYSIFAGTSSEVTPGVPTFSTATDVITIPGTVGVVYSIDGEDVVAGPSAPITEAVMVRARPANGYQFTQPVVDEWVFDPA
jgi:hypothetical protein